MMKTILLNEKDIRKLVNEVVDEVYRKGWSVNPTDAEEMFSQFVQAYETEGPNGQTTEAIYNDIWGFATTALEGKVKAMLGSRFNSFYYPEAVDRQFIAQKEHTMEFIARIYRNGNKNGNKDVVYNLAIAIANKLKDILDKNKTRSNNHVMAADTRYDSENGVERDIMDTLSDDVPTEEDKIDTLEKMKLYLQSYNKEMPNYIRQTLEEIIEGIEGMEPNVKEEILSMNLTDNKMQQMILMTALSSASNPQNIPYPELQLIIANYRKVAMYIMGKRTGMDPMEVTPSPKDIKNAIADRNPSGVLVLKTGNGETKEYAVNDAMTGIDNLINIRTKLSRLKKWFAEHDLDFEKFAQNARIIAEGKKRHTISEAIDMLITKFIR